MYMLFLCFTRMIPFPNPVVCYFVSRSVFLVQNNPKLLDPSYKMNLEVWDCFGSYGSRTLENLGVVLGKKTPT